MKTICEDCIKESPVITSFWNHPGFAHETTTCGMCGAERECVVIPIGASGVKRGAGDDLQSVHDALGELLELLKDERPDDFTRATMVMYALMIQNTVKAMIEDAKT